MINHRIVKQTELQAFRQEMGLSCAKLGEMLGCSSPMVNLAENGHKRYGQTIQTKIMMIFGVVIEWTNPPVRTRDQKAVSHG